MEFVDYYAVLNLVKTAKPREIQKAFDAVFESKPQPEQFEKALTAYNILKNPHKRARYDLTFGFLMVIQVGNNFYYPNAICYQLNGNSSLGALHTIIKDFKAWIEKKYDFEWNEALLGGFSYTLENTPGKTCVMLRFPIEGALSGFYKWLVSPQSGVKFVLKPLVE